MRGSADIGHVRLPSMISPYTQPIQPSCHQAGHKWTEVRDSACESVCETFAVAPPQGFTSFTS